MKIDNIEMAGKLANDWKTVHSLEKYIRSSPNLRNLEFAGKDGAMYLRDLTEVFRQNEIQDCIVDVLKELLDRKAFALLEQLKELDIDTETIAIEREALLNKEV